MMSPTQKLILGTLVLFLLLCMLKRSKAAPKKRVVKVKKVPQDEVVENFDCGC